MKKENTVRKHVGFNPVAWDKLSQLCELYGLGTSPMVCVCVAEKYAQVFETATETRPCDYRKVKTVADEHFGGDVRQALHFLIEYHSPSTKEGMCDE